MTDTLEQTATTDAEAWLHRTITARGGVDNLEDRERWTLYEQAKDRLGWPCPDYEKRVRALAEMLDL